MFEFRLLFIQAKPVQRDQRLVLRFSYGLRAVFALLAAAVILAMVLTGAPSLLGEFLAALTLLGTLFEERWTWEPDSRTLVHRSGVVFWARRRVFQADQITALELGRSVRGRNHGLFAKRTIGLSFESRDAGLVTIESHREKKNDDLSAFASALAEALGVPLRGAQEP